ncbi:reverse transcriptase domain-containing protein [Tanacetum coccineum]
MHPIREYLQLGTLPKDLQKARKLRIKASLYKIMDDRLYRRSYLSPWLRCVGPTQAKSIIQEIHQGINPEMRNMPNPLSSTKKTEAGNDTYNVSVALLAMGDRHRRTITNSTGRKQFTEVEVPNKDIVKGMERRLGKTHQGWVDELPQVLWAHRTTPKSSNGENPFSLVYGSEAVIPIEISVKTRRIQDFDVKKNEKKRREDLDILEERRELASIKEAYYKQKLDGYYNKRVRPSTFKPGTYVLRLNNASKAEFQGKIGPTWEGPYIVTKAYRDGTYKLETLAGSPIDRTWNRSNLCKFYVLNSFLIVIYCRINVLTTLTTTILFKV